MQAYLKKSFKKYILVPSWMCYRGFRNNSIFSIFWHLLACVCYNGSYYYNGLISSIILETFVLSCQMPLKLAFKTAIEMSLILMVSMEIAMNLTDLLLTGGAILECWVVPIMLLGGFITSLPYNYRRLKVMGKACH